MAHRQRLRNSSYSGKGGTLATPANVLPDDIERGTLRCFSSNFNICGWSSSYLNSSALPTETYQARREHSDAFFSIPNHIGKPAHLGWRQMSTSCALQSPISATLDKRGSDFDVEVGEVIKSRISTASRCAGVIGELNRADAGIPFRHDGHDSYPINWRDFDNSVSSRAHGSCSRSALIDHDTLASMKPVRRGSSPQRNDLMAPLDLDPRVFAVYESDVVQHVPVSERLLKSKGDSTIARCRGSFHGSCSSSQSTMANFKYVQRRKSTSSHGNYSSGMKTDDVGSGLTERHTSVAGTNRCGLSNCSSRSDLLPSLSSSALSNFTCFSAADVLPSALSSITIANHSRPRKASRALGHVDDREGYRCGHAMRQQVQDTTVLGCQETGNTYVMQSQDQGLRQCPLEVYRSKRASSSRQKMSNTVAGDTSSSSLGGQSLPPNYVPSVESGATRLGDRPRLSSRPSNTFVDGLPALGAGLSEQWLSRRRRALYETENSQYCTLPTSSLSVHEHHHSQPSFSAPPIRPPPLSPLTIFERDTASQDRPTAMASSTSPNVSNGSRETGTGLLGHDESPMSSPTRHIVEGLYEILSALEHVERDEELTYEAIAMQIRMLEATIHFGRMDLHDRYRDMRLDIDNMSYEELLAMEETIGNVHTGLDETSINRCVRVGKFRASASCGYCPQEVDAKCSICQEEFEEADELGVMECGHNYHGGCIKQWLLQKNRCPICKASALV